MNNGGRRWITTAPNGRQDRSELLCGSGASAGADGHSLRKTVCHSDLANAVLSASIPGSTQPRQYTFTVLSQDHGYTLAFHYTVTHRGCGRQNNAPAKDVHVPVPGACGHAV